MPLTLENFDIFLKNLSFPGIKQYKEELVLLKGVGPGELLENQRVICVSTF